MDTFSALLALCAGNSPVTSEFPSQRPVTRSFDVFFDLGLNKRLSKQSRRWVDLRRNHAHYDVIVMNFDVIYTKWQAICQSWFCCIKTIMFQNRNSHSFQNVSLLHYSNLEIPLNYICWTNAFLCNLRQNVSTNEIFYNTTCYKIDRSVALKNIVKLNVVFYSNLL